MINIETIPGAVPNAGRLKDWMNEHDMSAEDVGAQVGVSKTAIYQWVSGESRPTKALHQRKIEAITRGAVLASEWLTAEERSELAALAPAGSAG